MVPETFQHTCHAVLTPENFLINADDGVEAHVLVNGEMQLYRIPWKAIYLLASELGSMRFPESYPREIKETEAAFAQQMSARMGMLLLIINLSNVVPLVLR